MELCCGLNYLAVAINHKKVESSHTDMLLHLVKNIVKSKLHISLSMDEAVVDIKFWTSLKLYLKICHIHGELIILETQSGILIYMSFMLFVRNDAILSAD